MSEKTKARGGAQTLAGTGLIWVGFGRCHGHQLMRRGRVTRSGRRLCRARTGRLATWKLRYATSNGAAGIDLPAAAFGRHWELRRAQAAPLSWVPLHTLGSVCIESLINGGLGVRGEENPGQHRPIWPALRRQLAGGMGSRRKPGPTAASAGLRCSGRGDAQDTPTEQPARISGGQDGPSTCPTACSGRRLQQAAGQGLGRYERRALNEHEHHGRRISCAEMCCLPRYAKPGLARAHRPSRNLARGGQACAADAAQHFYLGPSAVQRADLARTALVGFASSQYTELNLWPVSDGALILLYRLLFHVSIS